MNNPKVQAIDFSPLLARPKEPRKEDPLKDYPWRMFLEFKKHKCRGCGQAREEFFIVSKSRERADKLFKGNKGLCGYCMAKILTFPRERICTVTGGEPNPSSSYIPEKEKPRAARMFSPYRLFGFKTEKPPKAAVHVNESIFFVIAENPKEAQSKLDKYGQCAHCICETLTLDRYCIETIDGGAP
jgi:hypothetical protein